MPVVNLPDDFSEQLEISTSGTINDTEGPGVAVYLASDGSARADIYIGLKLDGFKLYQNISSVDPNIQMQFSVRPIVSCQSDDLAFDPESSELISIHVSRRYKIYINYIVMKKHTNFVNDGNLTANDKSSCSPKCT